MGECWLMPTAVPFPWSCTERRGRGAEAEAPPPWPRQAKSRLHGEPGARCSANPLPEKRDSAPRASFSAPRVQAMRERRLDGGAAGLAALPSLLRPSSPEDKASKSSEPLMLHTTR